MTDLYSRDIDRIPRLKYKIQIQITILPHCYLDQGSIDTVVNRTSNSKQSL